MFEHNQNLGKISPSIFAKMSAMAQEHKAINLAQGFPDFFPPELVLKAMKNFNEKADWPAYQYAPSFGLLSLRQKIADNYLANQKIKVGAEEILITHGATEGLYLTARALLNPGDEVVIFTPCYDSYLANLHFAGAKIIEIPLLPPTFQFDPDQLKKKIHAKTKMIILNSPHNPTGKIFNKNEIMMIASCIQSKETYIVSDEVYEYMTYDRQEHFSFLNILELKKQTIVISGLGKTFGMTGAKIGWCVAHPPLLSYLHQVHQYALFCANHPFQHIMEETLPLSPLFLENFRTEYQSKKDFFVSKLHEMGLKTSKVQGTYFVLACIPKDAAFLDNKNQEKLTGQEIAEALCQKGLATIPLDSFFPSQSEHTSPFHQWIRFCFAKKDETLIRAVAQLKLALSN